jgi:hypothetical protein
MNPILYLTGDTLGLRYRAQSVNTCNRGFHGGDYDECRLLGYKIPVYISQEVYYVCATEPSRLILGKILGFCGGNYEEYSFLGYKNQVSTSQETH